MECKDFEKLIYVYSELSPAEKVVADSHIAGCSKCQILVLETQQMNSIVNQIAQDRIIPPHAAKLTGDIMSLINQSPKTTLQILVMKFLQTRILKISLSVASSLLVALLLIESFNDFSQVKSKTQAIAHGSIILNSRIFRQSISKRKNTSAECLSPFRSSQYILDCAKSRIK